MRRKARAWSAGAVAIGSLVAVSVGSGAESASRIIDRTLVCKVSGVGYPDSVRSLGVSATPYQATTNTSPEMGAGYFAYGYPGMGVSLRTGPAGRENETPTGELNMTRIQTGRCANTRRRIPFSSRGLAGGPTGPDRKWYRCDVPAKVVIRVRAVFNRPTFFRVNPRFPDSEEAKGDITTAYLAVTTLRGQKPLAFMSVHHATGKARIFVALSRCRPNQ
jgi:hypothetical protein